jgi:hypothetical protein
MDARAGARPVQIAGGTFANQLAPAGTRQGSDMRVGQMGKKKFHASQSVRSALRQAAPWELLPPTMSPPGANCNTAREMGLAVYLAEANSVVKSLKKTAPATVPVAIQTEWGQESSARFGKGIKTAKGVDGALTVPVRLSGTGGQFRVDAAGGSGGPAGVFVLQIAPAERFKSCVA